MHINKLSIWICKNKKYILYEVILTIPVYTMEKKCALQEIWLTIYPTMNIPIWRDILKVCAMYEANLFTSTY